MSDSRHVDIEAVKAAELDVILGRPPGKARTDVPPIWGLACSGGGIRSATFCLGVLQELARLDILRGFHYQSTVSGGGYVGAFVQGLIQRHGFDGAIAVLKASVRERVATSATGAKTSAPMRGTSDIDKLSASDDRTPSGESRTTSVDDPSNPREEAASSGAVQSAPEEKPSSSEAPAATLAEAASKSPEENRGASSTAASGDAGRNELRPILHLREYSNYLSPRKGALSGDTLGMFGTYVRNVVLIQIQLCALFVALSLLPLFLYPWIRHIAILAPGWCLIWATVLGFGGSMLLGLVTTSTRRTETEGRPAPVSPRSRTAWRSQRDRLVGVTDKTELPGAWVKVGAATIIWALALSAFLSAIGLWGTANKDWTIQRGVEDAQCTAAPSPNSGNTTASGTASFSKGSCSQPGKVEPSTAAAAPPNQGQHADKKRQDDKRKPVFKETIVRVDAKHKKLESSQLLTGVKLFPTVFGLYLIAWIVWLIYDEHARSKLHQSDPPELFNRIVRVMFATVVAGAFLAGSVHGIHHLFEHWKREIGLWRAVLVGPILTLAAFLLTGILHLGLAGNPFSDLQREVWARVGGKTAALTVIGIALPLTMIVLGPWAYRANIPEHIAGFQVGSVVVWLLTTGSGVVAAYMQKGGDQRRIGRVMDVVARVAPWVFLLGLIIAISTAAQAILVASKVLVICYEAKSHDFLVSLGKVLTEGVGCHIAVAMACALLTWGVFGLVIDINEFSLNAFYRNRLVRCYLGASNPSRNPEPTTNFDPEDDMPLSSVVDEKRDNGTRPLYPLIGATLNLLAVKQLDWLQRKAASFFFTPGYCGYLPPPSHPWSEPVGDTRSKVGGTQDPADGGGAQSMRSVAAHMTLGDATAISGAAVSPNMGYHSSPAATFLLTIFDARLGWWLPNPRLRRKSDFRTVFWGSWLIKEMLGLTDETGKFIYLSDGGHFENLGIYELVRRRCHFILAVDASADPNRDFEDLGNAVQKCRTDFGVDIDIDVSGLRINEAGVSLRSCALGRIAYPSPADEPDIGLLLYIKPTLTGKEPADVSYYARSHPSFPHEPTYNQFFDEAQFESYRRLGTYVAKNALSAQLERAKAAFPDEPDAIGVHDSERKDRILAEIEYRWGYLPKKPTARTLTHLNTMRQLFRELRRDPALFPLDTDLYPAWEELASKVEGFEKYRAKSPPGSSGNAPGSADFRKCFYFCQELSHLMESVYHDLNLELSWDHFDNRGWMNAFRQWSCSQMFRMAWAMGSPTYGARYVAFCQQRLKLPLLASVVSVIDTDELPEIKEKGPQAKDHWGDYCKELRDSLYINQREHAAIASDPVSNEKGGSKKIYLLRMDWGDALKGRKDEGAQAAAGDATEGGGKGKFSTLGVAVVSDGVVIVFRIQNHLRRLGLGREFMSKLVRAYQPREIGDAKILPGDYGLLGIYTVDRAEKMTQRARALLQKAKAQWARKGGGGKAKAS
jgi:hypothetical protein